MLVYKAFMVGLPARRCHCYNDFLAFPRGCFVFENKHIVNINNNGSRVSGGYWIIQINHNHTITDIPHISISLAAK